MTKFVDRPLTGRKVAMIFCAAFGVIIAVNLTLAFKAVSTFPGLEVKNSYVASQTFDAERDAQLALGWEVDAWYSSDAVFLKIEDKYGPIAPEIRSAVFGKATTTAQDHFLNFRFDGKQLVAPVDITGGNWNLRLVAEAPDGTVFKQRIVVRAER